MAAGASIVDHRGLQVLIDVLHSRGYRVLGPTAHDGAISMAEITDLEDLPVGVGDVQQPGSYRVRDRDDAALFGYATPVQSPKPVLFPAEELIWRGRREGDGFTIEPTGPEPDPVALLGVRSCDLAAIGIHDAVLADRQAADPRYTARRAATFIVAGTCAFPAGTCFCGSMGTGPRPSNGYDLRLTELLQDGDHRFLVEAGTAAGEQVLTELPGTAATAQDFTAADQVVADASARMGRDLDPDGLPDLLYASAQSPRWDAVAQRCLACTNCTMVCPTCFCTSVEDVSDLTGDVDERHRVWDSCFSAEYSHVHGGAVRSSTAARYRQWLTHKFGAWTEQFGMSGCVGCGRCITWCPAAIDVTEELAGLRAAADPQQ